MQIIEGCMWNKLSGKYEAWDIKDVSQLWQGKKRHFSETDTKCKDSKA